MNAAAQGNLKNLVLLSLGLGVVIVVTSFFSQFIQGFELKQAMKFACNDFIKVQRYGNSGTPTDPHEDFMRKVKELGLTLKREQYDFTVESDENKRTRVCKAKADYPVTVNWFLVDLVWPTVKPYTFTKKIRVRHTVADSY